MTQFRSTMWTLIDDARGGKEDALQEFVLRYRPAIVAFIRHKGFKAESEDLAQEVFLTVFKDGILEKADPSKGRFRNLLLAISRNIMGKYYEKMTAKKRGSGRVMNIEDPDLIGTAEDDDFDREWIAHLVQLAMERLEGEHANYHAALKRFIFEDASYEEIEKDIGVAKSTLKHHIHRGKLKLAGYIREELRQYSTSNEEYAEELAYFSRHFDL